MQAPRFTHNSVLLKELLEGLHIKRGDIVVDATINGAGHALEISKLIGKKGILVGIDLDSDALREAHFRLRGSPGRVILIEGNYRDVDLLLKKQQIPKITKAYFDLGTSSRQLDLSGRGFSFRYKEPLSMSFKKRVGPDELTAEMIVNRWREHELAHLLMEYGEEPYARRIAQNIVARRKLKRIATTAELVAIVEEATPSAYHRKRIHPATKTFQALRIAVNDEVEGLKEALLKIYSLLEPSGRIGLISFHSIEDRIVKQQFRNWKQEGLGMILTKKPIVPHESEIKKNPRSRSAKLRFFEKKKK